MPVDRSLSLLLSSSTWEKNGSEHLKNVVNQACHYGVQLEFSDEFLSDRFVVKRFLRTGRSPGRTARFPRFRQSPPHVHRHVHEVAAE